MPWPKGRPRSPETIARTTRRGSSNGRWKGGLVDCICQRCGATHQVKRNRIEKGGGRFCSRACSTAAANEASVAKHRAARVVKHCLECGKQITVKPSHASTVGSYCSRACMSKGYANRMQGTENPNYRHGRAHLPERANELGREWRRRHPEIVRLRNRHAKGTLVSERELRRLQHYQRDECAFCGERLWGEYHTDHIIPLTRGGAGHVGNIQLLCGRCNMSKGNKFFAAFRYRRSATASPRSAPPATAAKSR